MVSCAGVRFSDSVQTNNSKITVAWCDFKLRVERAFGCGWWLGVSRENSRGPAALVLGRLLRTTHCATPAFHETLHHGVFYVFKLF